jgi:hypothetical protein
MEVDKTASLGRQTTFLSLPQLRKHTSVYFSGFSPTLSENLSTFRVLSLPRQCSGRPVGILATAPALRFTSSARTFFPGI